mgnify:FL=1
MIRKALFAALALASVGLAPLSQAQTARNEPLWQAVTAEKQPALDTLRG